MKKVGYCVIGVVLGSLLAWTGLLGWSAVNLSPNDSLWDRNPQAANWFFALWFFLAVGGGVLGERLARRKP